MLQCIGMVDDSTNNTSMLVLHCSVKYLAPFPSRFAWKPAFAAIANQQVDFSDFYERTSLASHGNLNHEMTSRMRSLTNTSMEIVTLWRTRNNWCSKHLTEHPKTVKIYTIFSDNVLLCCACQALRADQWRREGGGGMFGGNYTSQSLVIVDTLVNWALESILTEILHNYIAQQQTLTSIVFRPQMKRQLLGLRE